MKKNILSAIITLLSVYTAFAQESGFSTYKEAAASYLTYVFKKDTVGFKKISNLEVWQGIVKCGKETNQKEAYLFDSVLHIGYDYFFNLMYVKAYQMLSNEFTEKGITAYTMDSVHAEKAEGIDKPCSNNEYYNLSIYLRAGGTTYVSKLGVMQFKNRWYAIDVVEPQLFKVE